MQRTQYPYAPSTPNNIPPRRFAGHADPSQTGGGGAPSPGAGRRPFLTPDRIHSRYSTLMDAFETADRRQRGYLPHNRVLDIYSLYFHASVGMLESEELTSFVDKHTHTSSDGAVVVDYKRLAEALRKRDFEQMTKAEARALRQSGVPQTFAAVNQQQNQPPQTQMPTTGVAAALHQSDLFGGGPPQRGGGGGGGGAPPPMQFLPRTGRGGGMGDGGGGDPLSPRRRPMMQQQQGYGEMSSPYGQMQQQQQQQYGGSGGVTGGYADDVHGAPAMSSPMRGGGGPSAAEVAGEGVLNELLLMCELADEEKSGRLHGAQLMTCCRMRGIEESSQLLRMMMADSEAPDGRVEYVKFVQQIAAQRAGTSARERVSRMHQANAEMPA